jgi:hypothetical protein
MNTIADRIAGLLEYSFRDIGWDFSQLTPEEQNIVGSQENLDRIREFVEVGNETRASIVLSRD